MQTRILLVDDHRVLLCQGDCACCWIREPQFTGCGDGDARCHGPRMAQELAPGKNIAQDVVVNGHQPCRRLNGIRGRHAPEFSKSCCPTTKWWIRALTVHGDRRTGRRKCFAAGRGRPYVLQGTPPWKSSLPAIRTGQPSGKVYPDPARWSPASLVEQVRASRGEERLRPAGVYERAHGRRVEREVLSNLTVRRQRRRRKSRPLSEGELREDPPKTTHRPAAIIGKSSGCHSIAELIQIRDSRGGLRDDRAVTSPAKHGDQLLWLDGPLPNARRSPP